MAWVSKFGEDDRWPEEEPIVLPSTMVELSSENSMAALPSSMDPMTGSTTTTSSTPLEAEDERLLELSKTDDLQETLKASRKKVEKVEKPEWVVRPDELPDDDEFEDEEERDVADETSVVVSEELPPNRDSDCFDDFGFAIACTGDPNPPNPDNTIMARLIKGLTRQRKLAGFDLWGGAPEWGDKAGRAPLDATGVVGLANVALQHGLVQEMVGLPQSYKDQLAELVGDGNYLTEHDIAGLNLDDRGALAQLMSGVFTKMHETQSQGFWSRVWEEFRDLELPFWQSIFGEDPTEAQLSQSLVDLTTSGLGQDIMRDPEVAVREMQELHRKGVEREWPERDSYGELIRQQNPLYQWG